MSHKTERFTKKTVESNYSFCISKCVYEHENEV